MQFVSSSTRAKRVDAPRTDPSGIFDPLRTIVLQPIHTLFPINISEGGLVRDPFSSYIL